MSGADVTLTAAPATRSLDSGSGVRRPGPTAATQSVHGAARLAYRLRDGRTALADLYQRDPQRVLFPRVPEAEPNTAVLVTTSGGLVGGDRLQVSVAAGVGTQVLVTTQAAEKIYRSSGADCRVTADLSVADGAWLEWLPQETILFDGARLRRQTRVDMCTGGRLLAGEMTVFGRTASGERLSHGLLNDRWTVRVGGQRRWMDAVHLADALGESLNAAAGFDGAVACATLIYVAPDAVERLELARALLPESPLVVSAATLVNGVLLMRWLARDALLLRRAYSDFRRTFRHRVAGLPAALPRLWSI